MADEMASSSIIIGNTTSTGSSTATAEPLFRCPVNFLYVFRFNTLVYALGPICALGICLNAFNVCVFRRMRESGQAIYLLTLMSCADIIYLANIFLDGPVRFVTSYVVFGDEVFRRRHTTLFPIWNWIAIASYKSTMTVRNWAVVLTAVVRCLHILFPLWSRRVVDRRFVNVCATTIVAIAAVLFVPRYFGSKIIYELPCKEAPSSSPVYGKFVKTKDMGKIFTHIYIAVTVCAPALILILANTVLLRSVSLSSVSHKKISTKSENDSKPGSNARATQLVIIATFVYLVCELPTLISRIVEYFVKYDRTLLMLCVSAIRDKLTPLDAAINCLIFVIASAHFRKTARNMLCKGRKASN
ncbi:uncharacterized protein LOC141910626 [Tubulanus polymorphus]|uniref:uncharacterized protein LOC141910626 n=1 Tax=Tubulanus polymorphus TaxID=672921 RepID=UPI003DA33A11